MEQTKRFDFTPYTFNQPLTVSFNQYLDFDSKAMEFTNKAATQQGVELSKTGATFSLLQLQSNFLKVTGFGIDISNKHKITETEASELISQKTIPMSTVNDHDLFMHVLPTIAVGYDFILIFDKVSRIEDPSARAWTFEFLFLVGFLKMSGHSDNVIFSVHLQNPRLTKNISPAGLLEMDACMNFAKQSIILQDQIRSQDYALAA